MQCGRVSARTVSYGTVYQLAVSARAISDSGVLAYECVMSYIFSKTLLQPFIFLSLSPCKLFLDQASVFIQFIRPTSFDSSLDERETSAQCERSGSKRSIQHGRNRGFHRYVFVTNFNMPYAVSRVRTEFRMMTIISRHR